MTIRSILERKGRDVVTIDPSITLAEAARILCERRIGALVAVAAGDRIVGILSERDIVWEVVARGADALEQSVSAIMTTDVATSHEAMTIDEAMSVMTSRRFRHLPVCENGRIVGIVSIGDVVKSRIEEVEREAEHMRAYIHTS